MRSPSSLHLTGLLSVALLSMVMTNPAMAGYDQLAKLTASDAAAGDSFGSAVSISANVAIVGASGSDDGGVGTGSAYLFAVPEPTSLGLLALGGVGLLHRRP